RRFPRPSPPPHFSISPDGKLLTAGSEEDAVRIWETASGKEIATFRAQAEALAFVPNSKTLATASGGMIQLWDVATGKRLDQALGHQKAVRSVAFARQGRVLATLGYDSTLRLWESTTGKEIHCLQDDQCVGWDLAASPDGKLLATTT